jgi:amino acid adenylation domain-containing protein
MAIGQDQEVHTESRRQDLSAAKRRLLQQRIEGLAPEAGFDSIRPRPAGAKAPLSVEQRRVWLHASQQPDVPVYNEPFTIIRLGSCDPRILEESINEVLRRHEIWRTSFSPEGEQVVHRNVHLSLPLVDLSQLAQAEREAEALRIATVDARTPIPLEAVPLFRAHVVRMKADEHRLYLTLHHIIFDAISISRIFLPELSAIYACLEQGKPCPLPPPELQYGDYALWRERHLESAEVKEHLAYWLDQLSGELPVLSLPEDHPRPAITSYRGSMECFQMPAELVENLRSLSRAQGVTLFMTLLAAFKVLLFRYTGQNDIIVGSPSDARRQPELEGVMGYFLDTFVIRTRPAAEIRFSEYLSQIRDSLLSGLAAADVPFERVVKELNPKRDTSRHPLFQAFFSIRPSMPRFAEGWYLNQMDVTVGTSKFELYLELCERPDQMEARFFYSTDIWDAPTIKRMAKHWLVLLESVCQNPESPLGTLPILTGEETVNLLGPGGWNDTVHAIPQATVSGLIEDHVRRTPHRIAATFGAATWTYEELNFHAEAYASLLRDAGVTRGSIVAILLDRSLDMLAALFAVLKTGAAYLPLDPHMPSERISIFLADARPSAIFTQRSLVQRVASSEGAVVLVDGDRESNHAGTMDAPPKGPTQSPNDPDDTAYLIYTSGTTGEPKAVDISQRSLVNLLVSMRATPGFGPEDVLLAVTPISFDIAAMELFLPLICAGTVAIANSEEARDPYLLAGVISRSGCTVMQTTPARWRTLLLSGWTNSRQNSTEGPSRMRRILCGGEALPRELAARLLATGAELWNMYGPTETAIWSLIHRVQQAGEDETSQVSVGRPIANTTAFIFDTQLQPLPIGAPGELFLGGAGLAKGYRGQPQKTAERFFTVESVGGIRLYRTGDVAVRRADGTIEVLGRTDNQVKVRGHRIELEAVEAAVLRHPRVAAAAARVWPEPAGDSRLSAYIVAANGASAPSLAEMRAFLRSCLTEWMIPSDVIPLPAIPLTRHGKIDRARLPSPSAAQTESIKSTPGSSEELRLATIWANLLERNHFGLDDNFFDLGGHSVLVAALQQRIAKDFELRIPIIELFHSPTIRQQAELMQEIVQPKPALPPGVLALQPRGTRKSIFWVHTLSRNLAEAIGDDQPFFSLGLTTGDITSLGSTPKLQDIAACHLTRILKTESQGPYIIGGHCANGVLAFEIASQLRALGHVVSRLILLDAQNPSYVCPRRSLSGELNHICYAVKRAARIGLRLSRVSLQWRFKRLVRRMTKVGIAGTELRAAQEMVEDAVSNYQPERYEGNVLLILASDRAPEVDLLRGWQAVVPDNLHSHYVDGHHTEILRAPYVRSVGNAIASHLDSTSHHRSPLFPAETPVLTRAKVDDKMALNEG